MLAARHQQAKELTDKMHMIDVALRKKKMEDHERENKAKQQQGRQKDIGGVASKRPNYGQKYEAGEVSSSGSGSDEEGSSSSDGSGSGSSYYSSSSKRSRDSKADRKNEKKAGRVIKIYESSEDEESYDNKDPRSGRKKDDASKRQKASDLAQKLNKIELKEFQKICLRRRDICKWVEHEDF